MKIPAWLAWCGGICLIILGLAAALLWRVLGGIGRIIDRI